MAVTRIVLSFVIQWHIIAVIFSGTQLHLVRHASWHTSFHAFNFNLFSVAHEKISKLFSYFWVKNLLLPLNYVAIICWWHWFSLALSHQGTLHTSIPAFNSNLWPTPCCSHISESLLLLMRSEQLTYMGMLTIVYRIICEWPQWWSKRCCSWRSWASYAKRFEEN